jgi:hypothetical protein
MAQLWMGIVSRRQAAARPLPALDNGAAAKYQALRSEAGAALADLDRLIASLER